MMPTESAIDSAVLRIFRNDFVHAEGRLSLSGLEEEWRDLHVRRDDLYEALDRLESRGLIRVQVLEAGLTFILTAAGEDRIVDILHPPKELFTRLRDSIQLEVVDHRVPSPATAPHNRRRGDPPMHARTS